MTEAEKYLIVLAGPTASGKTDIAIRLAQHYKTEIISADARQFYRELKIGTAAPSVEQLKLVPHHFIGHLSIHDKYDVGKYEQDVLKLLENLFQTHQYVVLCGGSGLFIKAITEGLDALPEADEETRNSLLENYKEKGLGYLQQLLSEKDPEYYKTVDLQNPKRLLRALEVCLSTGKPYSSFRKNEPAKRNFKSIKICLDTDRNLLYKNIDARVEEMMAAGLEQEAKEFFPYRSFNALQTVGYAELFDHIENKITLPRAVELIKQHTRNYAKRQLTWFRKDKEYIWCPADVDAIIAAIENQMMRVGSID